MFISTIDLKTEREIVKSEKGENVAIFEKGKCTFIARNLVQNDFYGYYYLKKDFLNNELEPYECDIPINFYRRCLNAKEYLKSFKELQYQPCSTRLSNNIYEEKELRLANVELFEFLEKKELYNLMTIKTIRKWDKKQVYAFTKYLETQQDNATTKTLINAFKKGVSVKEYQKGLNIRKVEKTLKMNENDAKYFLKKYVKEDWQFKYMIDMYQDSVRLNFNNPIGFPNNLEARHNALLKEYNEKKETLKQQAILKPMFDIKIKSKDYNIKVLTTGKDYKKYANVFKNCIYAIYLEKAMNNDYEIAIIFKNNKPYACAGFNKNKRMDQLYCKYNKLPPREEYNLLKRSLICL